MFVRKKKNRSGTTTVVVVEKRAGRHVYVRSIGSSILPSEIEDNAFSKTLFLTDRHKQIQPLFEEKFWVSQNYAENKEDT